MQSNRMSGDRPDELSSASDELWQGRVLSLILEEDPHQLTEHEIVRELAGVKPEFAHRDAIERALEALERAGLLRHCEQLVLPTKAARHFASLEVE